MFEQECWAIIIALQTLAVDSMLIGITEHIKVFEHNEPTPSENIAVIYYDDENLINHNLALKLMTRLVSI